MSSADPLFGIIIFVGIVGSAALIDYGRNRYRERKKSQSLSDLAKSYEFVGLANGVNEFLALSQNPIPTLQFIANAYIQSGNTQEAIKIYLSMLENFNARPSSENAKSKIDILQSLGTAYYTAGFLQRAKHIFLEILKHYPRNPQALTYLLRTYESLSDYKNAIIALECIEEIYEANVLSKEVFIENLKLNRAYLTTLLLINDYKMPLADKISRLQAMKATNPRLEKIILTFFKSTRLSLFWEEIALSEQINKMIDILWDFEYSQVPLSNLQHRQILDVYRAKGWVVDNQTCEIFELDSMRILHQHSTRKAQLFFEYRCHNCKHIFPFDNARCTQCGELLQSDVICKIREVTNEANYHLL